ncbi:sex comb on midleg-like protein 4 isoform X1 [Lates japonicus]|uniref:Sex comb on midleg-like protein 4 isoform X1 n=1 Tax=Lates japonicus TaxID=270547 RepID=A0AAD3M555_LATJO|nr:sex comb on midleg-like protein 4 isoform X1 [Lates japonicus]
MSVPAATAQKSDGNNSEMQSAAVALLHPSQSGRYWQEERETARNVAKMDFPNYTRNRPPPKVPKKRGEKPGLWKVSQIMSLYLHQQAGQHGTPNLTERKDPAALITLDPSRPSVVLQQVIQGCIDSAFQQKTVFTLLTQGHGEKKISANFDSTFVPQLKRPMAEDHLDDGKRYSVDPAVPQTGSASMSICAGSRPPAKTRSQKSNRTGGYNVSPESQESKAPFNSDPSTWSVRWSGSTGRTPGLGPHADAFRKYKSSVLLI